jgi:hypothetical protein
MVTNPVTGAQEQVVQLIPDADGEVDFVVTNRKYVFHAHRCGRYLSAARGDRRIQRRFRVGELYDELSGFRRHSADDGADEYSTD